MQTENLNQIYKWAWIVLIILAVFLGVRTLGGLRDLGDEKPPYNVITITGEGESFAIPDIATFSFSVSAEAKNVSDAQAQVTNKMNAVLAALKSLGIEDKDVKTTDYSVWPKYNYISSPCTNFSCPPGRQVQDGYTAEHSVMVKVRDTAKAGEALALAGEQGASNLSGISFTVDDPEKLTEEARALAIKNAKEKAEALSDDLGVRLGKVVSFYESSDGGYPRPYAQEGFGGVAVDMAAKAPTLPTGENKVKIVVSVTYEIK
jgi:uncharacterized protein YggE